MKIKKVRINERKKCFEVITAKEVLEYPLGMLNLIPTARNKIKTVFVDKELGNEAFTYVSESGKETTIHLDQVREYNKDPGYLREMLLYQLTLKAQEILKSQKLSKRSVIRRMNTSPTQFYRLLDQTNYHKTVDEMLKLLASLNYQVELRFKKVA